MSESQILKISAATILFVSFAFLAGCDPGSKLEREEVSPTPMARETPAVELPSPVPIATPALIETTPTPAPSPRPSLSPTPAPLTMAQLASSPQMWPKVVKLREKVPFEIERNGIIAGEIEVPSGTEVSVVRVERSRVQVRFQGSVKGLSAGQTDLLERAERLARIMPSDHPISARVSATPTAARAPPREISIVTWNIEFFPGKSRNASANAQKKHITEVTNALRKIQPDILVVEELRDPDALGEALQVLPKFQIHIVSRFKYGAELADQQVAIASRFQADSAFAEAWQHGPTTPPRGFSFAAIELENRTVLLTYGVHLKSNRGDESERPKNMAMREEAARQLVTHIAEMEKTYRGKGRKTAVIVGGDFNLLENAEFAGEKTVNILKESGLSWGWEGVPLEKRITWPPRGKFAGACFDHFFFRGIEMLRTELLPIENASDHLPVRMIFALKM